MPLTAPENRLLLKGNFPQVCKSRHVHVELDTCSGMNVGRQLDQLIHYPYPCNLFVVPHPIPPIPFPLGTGYFCALISYVHS